MGVFGDDQALFDEALARAEATRFAPEEPEPEPAAAAPEPEPVPEPEPIPEPEIVPLCEPEEERCANFSEHYGYGPSGGSCCQTALTKNCLRCTNLRRETSILAQSDTYQWGDWELRQFLENLGFAVHPHEALHTLQEKVRNILDTMRIVAKIASLQDEV